MVDTEANLCISSLQALHMQKGKYMRRQSFVVRHEMINHRIKQFSCVGGTFRHGPEKDGIAFRVAAVITQLAIDKCKSLLDWEYAVEYDT
jgi:hypothetical protein